MGRASRRKHEEKRPRLKPTVQQKPRWAGAHGFDYAWILSETYQAVGQCLMDAKDPLKKAEALQSLNEFKLDISKRKLGTLEAAYSAAGGDLGDVDRHEQMQLRFPVFPDELEERIDFQYMQSRPYASAFCSLAFTHLEMLSQATPILFDPLTVPAVDQYAMAGLRLPFPVTVCDFLAQSGMSLPVQMIEGRESDWVGVVAATFAQVQPDVLDCWPVVTTLHAREDDENQEQGTVMFGRARFGADLPDAPEGMTKLKIDGASVWIASDGEDDMWAQLWVTRPALAAASALRLLEAVNVSLETVELRRPERRRAQREGAQPALEVVIRTSARSATFAHGTVDWQHRWTVRGHWKHFRRGSIFNANPRKRVRDANGSECVRVWCPPFVKGPEGKPLVLKARRADHPSLSTEDKVECVSNG